MGIGVVLLVYAIGLTIMACLGAVVLGVASYLLTRKAVFGRKRAVTAAAAFPFVCVVFAGLWFIAYASINDIVFHRDPGVGDTWQTPLPNGYALNMIDTTDQGTVYNPKTQPTANGISSQDDAIFGVRQLQVANDLIFGAADSEFTDHLGKQSNAVDSYFELNTRTATHRDFKSLDELRKQATTEGIGVNLRPFASVFDDYRYTWFDSLAGAILLMVPLVGFVFLLRWIMRVRRSGDIVWIEAR